MELPSLSAGVSRYRDAGGSISLMARTQNQLFDKARVAHFVREALRAHVVIVTLHGGKASCPAFDDLLQAMGKGADQEAALSPSPEVSPSHPPHLHIQPMGGDDEAILLAQRHSDGMTDGTWKTLQQYLALGGAVNMERALAFLSALLKGGKEPAPGPQPVVQEGLYHPRSGLVQDLVAYLKKHVDPRKPTVGLWFYQTLWLNGNLAHVDALIEETERRGANVLPVFSMRFKDSVLGNRGADEIVSAYFMDGEKPRIHVLINAMSMSMTLTQPHFSSVFPGLNVPVIQAMSSSSPLAVWKESPQGMSVMDVTFQAAQPEFDGALIHVPVATREEDRTDPVTGGLIPRWRPLRDRVAACVSLALNWARLRRKPNDRKRVAIVFHHYPPRNDRIGCAAGLDSFAGVKHLLDAMDEEGYHLERLYEDGDELAGEMLQRMTCDRRWLTPDQMFQRAEAFADRQAFEPWHDGLPGNVRRKMAESWGPMPGDLFVHEDTLCFAGLLNGNVFLTVQPPRGQLENPEAILHDPHLPPTHHYLAHYRWIRHVFQADAVIHVGKHGSLEWLPGKALGLSEECYPDLSIMDLPNIYPYIINDPSEGTQAKRRSYCCIVDHLTPAFTNADLYEDLAQVERTLAEYTEASRQDPSKLRVLQGLLWEAVEGADLHRDLELTREEALGDMDRFLERLHTHLSELSDTMIGDGLHVLGQPPQGERLVEFLVQLTRLGNGHVPSLREEIMAAMGHNHDDLLAFRGKVMGGSGGKTGGQLIAEAHEHAVKLVKALAQKGFQSGAVPLIVKEHWGTSFPRLERVLHYAATVLVPHIQRTTEEIDACLRALSGGFVPPGPSGAPTRGQADILPTGRNFYSLDPRIIPTPAAWETGKALGDALLQRYLEEEGRYPENVGIVVWGGPTMRSRGDDMAQILYLLGVKPLWQPSGVVSGLEIIPFKELGRPRVDVTPRISGFFRDAFPNLVQLLDEAVRMVAALEEREETNFIRSHVLADREQYRQNGLSEEEAWRLATLRVFGCPPGTYGAGVAELVESRQWKSPQDLGNAYIRYSAHAYGQGHYGTETPETFRRHLSRMDVTVKNEDSREYDMLSCTDFYNYHGGLIAAAAAVRGSLPSSYVGDASDPKRVKFRSTQEEARHVLRSRLLNPRWLEGMKRHGYKGAGDISKVMDILLGWDATADVMEDWMYERVAKKYALDREMQQWLKKVNPYALQNILDKLLETMERGMWKADEDMRRQLEESYLEVEGDIEEVQESWETMQG